MPIGSTAVRPRGQVHRRQTVAQRQVPAFGLHVLNAVLQSHGALQPGCRGGHLSRGRPGLAKADGAAARSSRAAPGVSQEVQAYELLLMITVLFTVVLQCYYNYYYYYNYYNYYYYY